MRAIKVIAAVMVASLLALSASAEMVFEGCVTGGAPVLIKAPFGGVVEHVNVLAGDRINQGDTVAQMSTTRVYAPCDGTVSGVFGVEGDSTDGITERYGAVMYVEPVCKYTVTASTEKAYNISENKFIHIGEKVYLCCVSDGTHRGSGIVTGFTDDGKYNVEINAGEFCMEETVGLFRASDYSAKTRIGRGTVAAAKPVPVKCSGSIVKMHVKNGDTVERGELLFETAEGVMDGLYSPGSRIVADVTGIVAEVSANSGSTVDKGGTVMTVYPDSALMVDVPVTEADLSMINVGDGASIVFNWDLQGEKTFEGTVTRISYISSAESGEPIYTASIAFTPDDTVRMGMTVLVYIGD